MRDIRLGTDIPCTFYTAEVLGLLDSCRNRIHTVVNVLSRYIIAQTDVLVNRDSSLTDISERVFSGGFYNEH